MNRKTLLLLVVVVLAIPPAIGIYSRKSLERETANLTRDQHGIQVLMLSHSIGYASSNYVFQATVGDDPKIQRKYEVSLNLANMISLTHLKSREICFPFEGSIPATTQDLSGWGIETTAGQFSGCFYYPQGMEITASIPEMKGSDFGNERFWVYIRDQNANCWN